METREFKRRLRARACPAAIEAFDRARTTPKKWLERVFRMAKVQVRELIDQNYTVVWFESVYSDGETRTQLGWVAWVFKENGTRYWDMTPDTIARAMKKMDFVKEVEKFLRAGE